MDRTLTDARARLQQARLYLLLTRRLCRQDPLLVLRGALAGGASMVQVREPEASDRDLREWLASVKAVTEPAGVLLIVNNRPDLALLAGADGVHLGQDDLSVPDARRIVGSAILVGLSTHDRVQAEAALSCGADYIGIGPLFDTRTKGLRGRGPGLARDAVDATTLPAFGIGGITPENVAALREAGLTRVAVSGAICGAADPEAAARAILAALGP